MTSDTDFLLSIVAPVFNEEQVVAEFLKRAREAVRAIGCRYELVIVSDGCTDNTIPIVMAEQEQDPHLRLIILSRNFGHQAAITAGLDHAKGDAVITIDADLQDPPELFQKLVDKWREGFDVVHAKRLNRRGETVFKKLTAHTYYRLMKSVSNVELPVDVGDYRLISRKLLNALGAIREKHRYIRGLVAWLGFKQTFVEYERHERHSGITKFPLMRMLRFAATGLASFSVLPLRLATFLGLFIAFISACYIAYALYIKVVLNIAVLGWTSVIMAVLMVGGIQLICLGIIGEYIGIIYDEVKSRPIYLVSDIR